MAFLLRAHATSPARLASHSSTPLDFTLSSLADARRVSIFFLPVRLRRVKSCLRCSPFAVSSPLKNLWFYVRGYQRRGRLDFVRIPNRVCSKILQHLKFKERVRLARVSRRFQEMSDLAVSQTESLDLADPMFEKATPDSMERLITKCAESLERVVYTCPRWPPWPYEVDYYPSPDYRLVLLSKVRCPHLVRLDLGEAFVENDVLRDLLVNCPNLREFSYYNPTNPVFPVSCEKMEIVDVRWCQVGFLLSLTYQCPNLTSFDYEAFRRPPSEQLLDEMLANVPNLERLTLKVECRSSPPYQCANMSGFTNLRSLRSLDLQCRGITDQSLRMISKSFGQLERLRVVNRAPTNVSLTGQGIGALSSLENLREFSWELWAGWPRIDDGIQLLASRGRLQRASFEDEFVSERTMVTFVQCCRGLRELRVKNVQGIRRRKDALRMLRKFAGFQQPNVAIHMKYPWVDWNGRKLKAALDQFNASAGGGRIEIYHEFTASTDESSTSGDESGGDDDSVTAMESEEE